MFQNDELKNECNRLYSEAIDEMKAFGSVSAVRNKLLSTAEKLLKISVIDSFKKRECEAKAKKLLEVVKTITCQDDIRKAYFALTGQVLGVSAKSKEISIEEKIPNSRVEEAAESIEQNNNQESKKFVFNWDERPSICFDDVAGLEYVKEIVRTKVILPLKTPELFEGYEKKNGGGILLYGLPGTGKTMIAAAIAHEINAKFCSIGPSDILVNGIGNSEKLISTLFREARSFKCSVIFFDELESLCPISTHAQHARQIRSELLKQMQGLDAYKELRNKILLLIGATNKPWEIDPAFVRPGRFDTRAYVDLPDDLARKYMIEKCLKKISSMGQVKVAEDINIDNVVECTTGFNGADITNLLDAMQENSIRRAQQTKDKIIIQDDFDVALNKIHSSVQIKDVERLEEWRKING